MNKNGARRIVTVLFAVYIALLIFFILFKGQFGNLRSDETHSISLSEYFEKRGNLTPFKTIRNQTRALRMGNYSRSNYIMNIAGNVAAFAPFAFFLPYLFRRQRNFFVFFPTVSAIILAVEVCQLLLRVGSFDVDDYILNALGACIAFAILSAAGIWRKKDPRRG